MSHRTFGLRLLVGLGLLLSLIAATTATAGAQEVGSVSIYKIECPAGFDSDSQADLYNACYGNPVSGQSFSAQQGKSDAAPAVATTGADGWVTLPLYGGATTISEGLPQGISEYFVFCSHEDGSAVEFEYTGDTFGIFLEEEGGDYFGGGSHLHCDWYNVPAADDGDGDDGTVTIHRTSCPAGYTSDDYYSDCSNNPAAGIQFFVREAGTDVSAGFSTGPDGLTSGPILLSAPGTLVITETPAIGDPLPYLDYVVFCATDDGREIAVDYGQTGVMDIVIAAAPDDVIGCDWFYVPPASSATGDDDSPTGEGTLTVYATACPDGYTGDDYFDDCYDNPVAGLAFAVSDAKTDFTASDTTNGDGFATLPIPDVISGGELALNQTPAAEVPGGADPPFVVSCTENDGEDIVAVRYSLIQLDPGGDAYYAALAVEPGDVVRCDWFVLDAGSDDDGEEDGSGVIELPSTGVGAASDVAVGSVPLLLTLGALGGAIALVGRRRRALG